MQSRDHRAAEWKRDVVWLVIEVRTEGAHAAGEEWALGGSDNDVRERDRFLDRSLRGVCHRHGGRDRAAVPPGAVEIPDVDIATSRNRAHQLANILSDACEGRSQGHGVDRESQHRRSSLFLVEGVKTRSAIQPFGLCRASHGVGDTPSTDTSSATHPWRKASIGSEVCGGSALRVKRKGGARALGPPGYPVVWRVSLWYVRNDAGRWSVGR